MAARPDTRRSPLLEYLGTPARQTATVRETAHRPWPLPGRSWVMGQTWDDLLFAHWPLRREAVQRLVPDPLPVDTFEGEAWIGVTPFVLTGLRLTATPPLPPLSTFPELNVRTYVTVGGKPGIYFFSLDAASRLAVAAARRFYRLPYFLADMSAQREGDEVEYRSQRRDDRGHPAAFAARYRSTGTPSPAPPASLEHFLTERYCLYTLDERGGVLRADIHHPPWPLERADAEIDANTMPPPGLGLPAADPLLHFSARQDVVIWAPRPVDGDGGPR